MSIKKVTNTTVESIPLVAYHERGEVGMDYSLPWFFAEWTELEI
jgi:hypothetical protein